MTKTRTTYDLRINSHGKAQPMAHGFFKRIAELLDPGKPYVYEERCELVGIYWVEKFNLDPEDNGYQAKTIRAFLEKAAKKTSEAQLRAGAKYDAANTRQIMLKLNKTTDADILKHLDAVDNVQGYIKKLVREDMTH